MQAAASPAFAPPRRLMQVRAKLWVGYAHLLLRLRQIVEEPSRCVAPRPYLLLPRAYLREKVIHQSLAQTRKSGTTYRGRGSSQYV